MTIIDDLSNRATSVYSQKGSRILITVGGIPGSGKSTTAALVAEKLNSCGISTTVVGMDGYHYSKKELARQIGPEKAVKYRGAPYTFDAKGVVDLANKLAYDHSSDILFPTFDHAIKDPVSNDGVVPASTQVVIFEGLYLHLADPIWQEIMPLASDSWFIEVNPEIARERLAFRHLQSGIVSTIEEGYQRADSNDLVNGRYIKENSMPAKYIVNTSNSS